MSGTEQRVRGALTDIAAFLCDEPDIEAGLDFLAARCADLLGVAAGMMAVAGRADWPDTAVCTSEPIRLVQEFTQTYSEGPLAESFTSGARVDYSDLAAEDIRWPRFGPFAQGLGLTAMHTLPMRRPDRVLGVLTLSAGGSDGLALEDLELAQALANVGALGIASYRTQRSEQLAAQLQSALRSRVVIEQAKGLLAERMSISVDEAFLRLRAQARNERRKIHEIAGSIVGDHTASPGG